MISASLIAVCAIITFAGAKTSYYVLKFLAGLSWMGLAAFWLANPFIAQGSPTDVIIIMTVLFMGLGCMLWAFWTPSISNGRESGGRFRIPFVTPTDEEEEAERQRSYRPTRAERNEAYSRRVDRALQGRIRRR